MTPDQWFAVANPVALAGWLMLAASLFMARSSPGRVVLRAVAGRAIPLVLCVGYGAALLTGFGSTPAGAGFATLSGVAALFSVPVVLLAGWVHYLAFDLLVGRWIVDAADERGMPALLVLPCLLLTFMLGPLGWLLFMVLRLRRRLVEALNGA